MGQPWPGFKETSFSCLSHLFCFRSKINLIYIVFAVHSLHIKERQTSIAIPRSILEHRVTASCFAVMLYLYLRAGREGRAYPSIQHMAGKLKDRQTGCGASKASVCRALLVLKKLKFFIKLLCRRVRGDYACNTYMLTDMVSNHRKAIAKQHSALEGEELRKIPTVLPLGGSLKIGIPSWINKITKGYIRRKREIGVFQFSKMYNLFGVLAKIPFLSKYMARPPTADR